MVRDVALHREATGWANQEGYESLAGWLSVEGTGANHKAGRGGNACIDRQAGAC